MTEIKTKIIDAVKNNKVHMIPKWQFVLYSCLTITSVIFFFLLSIFLFSLVLFVLSRYGILSLPFFEVVRMMHTLRAVPLALLVCTVLLLIIIELISQRYRLASRRPLAVTFMAFASFAVIVSFFISQTSFHEKVRDYAKGRHFDAVVKAYDRPMPFDKRQGPVIRGTVVSIASSSLVVQLFDSTHVTVMATNTSLFINLNNNDDVAIFGNFENKEYFVAKDIRQARDVKPRREKEKTNDHSFFSFFFFDIFTKTSPREPR
ncbi:MAG: hypothetical protein RLZZ308_449 [Candidatus Parcubacteria bacterium]|jgi:amino acid transporter